MRDAPEGCGPLPSEGRDGAVRRATTAADPGIPIRAAAPLP